MRSCQLLDASGATCAVFTLSGHLLHRTPPFERVLRREPRRCDLIERARRLALSLATGIKDPEAPAAFVGVRGRYTLTSTRVHDPEPIALVSVTLPASPGVPREDEVRALFGLTRRQAEVAVLLADRHSNREIAAALGISEHTARHHVGSVLATLGVTRRGVRSVLLAACEPARQPRRRSRL